MKIAFYEALVQAGVRIVDDGAPPAQHAHNGMCVQDEIDLWNTRYTEANRQYCWAVERGKPSSYEHGHNLVMEYFRIATTKGATAAQYQKYCQFLESETTNLKRRTM